MKGMKRTNGKFKKKDFCQLIDDAQVMSNLCIDSDTMVKEDTKKQKKSRWKRKRIGLKKTVALLMMLLGGAAIILGIMAVYSVECYSEYFFMNRDRAFIAVIFGLFFFISGIELTSNP